MRATIRLVAAALCASVSGCALLPSSSSSAPTPAASTTPSPVPVGGSSPAKAPALRTPPLSKGNNWNVVLPQLLTYGQWVLATANATSVGNVAAPGCPFQAALSNLAQQELSDGEFLLPSQLSVLSVQVPATVQGTEVTLATEAARNSESLVDGSGTVLGTASSSLAPTWFDITVDLGADHQWRICSIAQGSQSSDLSTDPGPLDHLPNGEEGLALL